MNFGAFSRAFNVPEKIDEDKVSAVYIDGVLEIRLLKIKAPPVDGKANKYLIGYLSEVFGLPKKNIETVPTIFSNRK